MFVFEGFDIESTGGVKEDVINKAIADIGVEFSAEFYDYLLNYGTVEFNGNELFGLGVNGYCNIVNATNKEKALSARFPDGYCVIYNIGVDSVLILLGSDGCIYEYTPQHISKIYDSFNAWILDELVKM